MADDDPVDDLRVVAMTAGAAAARVAETLLRAQQDKERGTADTHRSHIAALPRTVASQAASYPAVKRERSEYEVELDLAMVAQAWAKENQPETYQTYHYDQMGADSVEGRQSARRELIRDWRQGISTDDQRTSEPPAYDSATRRDATDREMAAAGVPDEARNAKTTADLLNGTEPQHAAAAGSKTKGRPVRAQEAPSRQRSR